MSQGAKRASKRRLATTDAADILDEAADEEPEIGPLRRCAVTRERGPKEKMIRFVVGPGRASGGKTVGEIVPDISATLPGRGIWLSARADVIETARKRGAFARIGSKVARGPVVVPPDLLPVLQAGLVRRIGELLGLARRAGQAICGFEKARAWLISGRAGLVMQAADGSAAERARFLSGSAGRIPVVAPLSAAALGAIFGRDPVVHVVVAPGRLAAALAMECERLAGLMGPGVATNDEEAVASSDRDAVARSDRDATDEDAGDGAGVDGSNKRAGV